jgi:hypothetical protein
MGMWTDPKLDRKAQRLRTEARTAAKWRGHDLGKFRPTDGQGFSTARCRKCSADVWTTPTPNANGAEIVGNAVATNCPCEARP